MTQTTMQIIYQLFVLAVLITLSASRPQADIDSQVMKFLCKILINPLSILFFFILHLKRSKVKHEKRRKKNIFVQI